MNQTNGFHQPKFAPIALAEVSCPACGSNISREKFDHIMRLDDARKLALNEEHELLQRERESVTAERDRIVEEAAATERMKWASQVASALAEAEQVRKLNEARVESLAREYERRRVAESKLRDAGAQKLVREIAAANAKARDVAEARVREAKEEQREKIAELRADLRTVEQRRQREAATMKETIVELQRKAEVRERAHFGPEGEANIVTALREQFVGDRVEHHGKGGDVLHRVIDSNNEAGQIVYEIKNTRGWQLSYLRDAKRAMEVRGTTYGILVTRVMPSRQGMMTVMAGVIVVLPAIAVQVAAVVRSGIIAIGRLRLSEQGKAEKTTMLFDFLRGDEFTASIRRVQEKVLELRESLSREKSHHDGWWASRENHYATILRAASGIEARVSDLLGSHPPRTRVERRLLSASGTTRSS